MKLTGEQRTRREALLKRARAGCKKLRHGWSTYDAITKRAFADHVQPPADETRAVLDALNVWAREVFEAQWAEFTSRNAAWRGSSAGFAHQELLKGIAEVVERLSYRDDADAILRDVEELARLTV